jgi:hypothetical protein
MHLPRVREHMATGAIDLNCSTRRSEPLSFQRSPTDHTDSMGARAGSARVCESNCNPLIWQLRTFQSWTAHFTKLLPMRFLSRRLQNCTPLCFIATPDSGRQRGSASSNPQKPVDEALLGARVALGRVAKRCAIRDIDGYGRGRIASG